MIALAFHEIRLFTVKRTFNVGYPFFSAGITFFLKIILENAFLENEFLRKLTHFLRKRFWEIFSLGAGPSLRSAVGEHVSEASFL